MAIGGFLGSALAGLTGYDRAQQEAQQNQYRQIQQRMLMQEMQQRQQQERQQQEAMRLAYGGLGGLGGLGGAPPLQQMPQTPMPQMGGGQPNQGMLPSPREAGPTASGYGGTGAGGIPARGTPERQQLKSLIYKDESGGQNIEQGVLPPGGGYNPSVGRVTGPSSASGYGQITDSTWRDTPTGRASGVTHAKNAPFEVQDKAVDDLIDKRGVQPWAPYNAKLREDLQRIAKGGQALGQQVAQDIPPMAQGRMGLAQMKEAIDKAAPDADGATKMMAIMQLHQMLAPYEKMQFQQYMKDNQQTIQLALKDMQIRAAELRQDKGIAAAGDKGTGQVIQRGDKFFQMTPNGPKEIQFPGEGAVSKVGSASQSGISPETGKFMADGIANYQLPPLSGWALKSPNGQSLMAEVMKINPKYDATEYTAKQSGARAVGTRSKTLEMATGVAEELIPLAQETSDKIDRTQFPTVNAMIIAADKGTGGEDVVRFLDQLNSLKYAYARALNPTGQARVEDLKRFDDILDTSWSKGQVRAALDQMRQSLAAERRGIEKTRKGEGGAASASPSGETPTVSSPEEYAKLPKGARYKGPDGAEYTKGQ